MKQLIYEEELLQNDCCALMDKVSKNNNKKAIHNLELLYKKWQDIKENLRKTIITEDINSLQRIQYYQKAAKLAKKTRKKMKKL
jgi:hypothetical protein